MEIMHIKSLLGGRSRRVIILVVAAFLAGYFLKSVSQQASTGTGPKQAGRQAVTQKWTCSMHPEIIRDKPGKCPKCGMDLIPLMVESAAGLGPRQLVISEDAAKLMEIQTSIVERKFVTA